MSIISLRTFGPTRSMGPSATWPPTEPAPPEPDPPTITGNASPVQAPASGGTTHMLPGTNFEGATGLTVNGALAPFWNVAGPNQIEFEAPPYSGEGSLPVGVYIVVLHPLGDASRNNGLVYMAGE